MRFKLPIVLFALFALTAAACSSSETADVEESPTTTQAINIVDIGDESDENDDDLEIFEEVELIEEDEVEDFEAGVFGDGTDEIITHVSTGDICDDFRLLPPHRDGGQATDLDENGLPYGTKYRTTYLEHSQPEPEPIQLEGSEFIYVPWREYEGRKIWESYPLDIELYSTYFAESIKRDGPSRLAIGNPLLYLDERAKWQALGCDWMQATKEIWDTADIYLPEIQALADEGKTIYRYTEDGTGIVDAVDPEAGFPLIVFENNAGVASSWYDVCPPSPRGNAQDPSRYNLRGVDPALIARAQGFAAQIPEPDTKEMEWFLEGIVTPEGQQIYSDHDTTTATRALLNLSPGEPGDTTLDSDATSYSPSLILDGYFPGDWSENALEILGRQVAATAVWSDLANYAILGGNNASIWDKCTDLEATTKDKTELGRSVFDLLESNISKGLDLIVEGEPTSEVYTAFHTTLGSYALLCSQGIDAYFQDSVSGEKVPRSTTFSAKPAISGTYYSSTTQGFTLQDIPVYLEGECRTADGSTTPEFEQALRDLTEYVDNRHPTWEIVPDHKWYSVSQEEAWDSYRYPMHRNRIACEAVIPRGEIIDDKLSRPVNLPCSNSEWQAMEEAALTTPERTDFLVGQKIGQLKPNISFTGEYFDWFQANKNTWIGQWYTERLKASEYIGCGSYLEDFAYLPYPLLDTEKFSKKPWLQGELPESDLTDNWGYPAVHTPCLDWKGLPETDEYWWPLP